VAIGCYIPQYAPASFKGVGFEAEEVTSEHGRRGAEGEFPFGEQTGYADLGRKIRRYTLKGRYVNNDHIASASAIIAACESPGPGLLIHPTRGAIMVACTRLSVTDDPLNEQGITHLDFEFVEANEFATGLGLGISIFGISLVDITATLSVSFQNMYRMRDVRYYNVAEVQQTVVDGMSALRTEFRKALASGGTDEQWLALSTMDMLIADPTSLTDASTAFSAFERSIKTLSAATSGQAKYDAFRKVANTMARVSSLPGESGDAQDAVYSTVRILSAANMAKAALEVAVVTLDDALRQYDAVVTIISQEVEAAKIACDTDLYLELRKFETELKKQLLNRAYNLPSLVEYDFGGGVHSLVAAHAIFGDAKRFKEIEERNPLSWPFAIGPKIIATRS
jgi:prophage DNA circulation protein